MFPQRQVGELTGYLKKMTVDSQRQVCWRVGYLKNGKIMDAGSNLAEGWSFRVNKYTRSYYVGKHLHGFMWNK